MAKSNTYVLVDKETNIVVDRIVWDGVTKFGLDEAKYSVVKVDNVDIDYSFIDGAFIAPVDGQ